MSKILTLKIHTPEGVFFEDGVLSFNVPTTLGPLEVEPGYTNVITTLAPTGVMWIKKDNGKSYYAVFGGVLRVENGDKATLFTQEINDGYEIDMARAIAARDRNLDRIAKPDEGTDLIRARYKLNKALARISAKSLSEGKRQG